MPDQYGEARATEMSDAGRIFRLRGPFRYRGKLLWSTNLPYEFADDSDDVGYPQCSAWVLYEDGKSLGPMHSETRDIADLGGGRARHWRNGFEFSTSDNTDPNANGRDYTIRWTGGGDKKWLALLNAAPIAKPAPFGERPEIDRCHGVIAVIGWSYSGSTLVTAFAGAHPEIFGGGELHWLIRAPLHRESDCAICGRRCRLWTVERRAAIAPETLYHDASRIFGRRFVVDSSKNPPWFRRILPHYPDLPTSRILLTKHPVRQVSSELEKARGTYVASQWEQILVDLRAFYEEVALSGEQPFRSKYFTGERVRADVLLRYEDFTTSPETVLSAALARLGLAYDPRMAAWQSAEHHHIGGNVGPTVQINNSTVNTAIAEKKYRARGIFLDNSFADVLDLGLIAKILRHPDAQWMCDRFGYTY
jgi:hypothetical protein